MNRQLTVIASVLIALFLSGCCSWCVERYKEQHANECINSDSQDDPFLHAYRGNCASRIWVVDDAGSPNEKHHLVFGGAFRIEKTNGEFRFRPLTELRHVWGINNPDFSIPLSVTDETRPRLCGTVNLTTHPNGDQQAHVLLFDLIGPDSMDVSYEVFVDGAPNQCTHRGTHGGVAHVEN